MLITCQFHGQNTESDETILSFCLLPLLPSQYQSQALVIRYNRAVLEPSGDFHVEQEQDVSSGSAAFPWWGIVIIVGVLVLVATMSVVILVSIVAFQILC